MDEFKLRLALFFILTLMLVFTACGKDIQTIESSPIEVEYNQINPEEFVQNMTLREKVGQLFIVYPQALVTAAQSNGTEVYTVTELSDELQMAMRQYPVGGLILSTDNLVSPEQIKDFTSALQKESKIPLFISIDEEGGAVSRLANHAAFSLPKYKSAEDVGKSTSYEDGFDMGCTIGKYLHAYGFNMNFAPVADVNTNPNNPVIGNRAFSSDATVASNMARAVADGLRSQNIIPVYKHFPGHGDTAEDSHKGLAVSYKNKEELKKCEWIPFQNATDQDGVMVGHIALLEVFNDTTPATMSHEVVTDILKNELGFEGLVITDSLIMQGITDHYTPEEATIGAIKAGCDILLIPNDFPHSFNAVIEAVSDGTIMKKELDTIVKRIIVFKQKNGLFNKEMVH